MKFALKLIGPFVDMYEGFVVSDHHLLRQQRSFGKGLWQSYSWDGHKCLDNVTNNDFVTDRQTGKTRRFNNKTILFYSSIKLERPHVENQLYYYYYYAFIVQQR